MKLNIKIDDQRFVVEVGDLNSRPVRVQVDGETFEVWPEEAASPLAPARPAPQALTGSAPTIPVGAANQVKSVLAPIPGVIVSVGVKVGDRVAFGLELCVLEAMKMKNQIRANRAGTVAAVHITAGDSVKHSQVLIEYSD